MCGIFFLVFKDGVKTNKEILRKSFETISYRGPDHSSFSIVDGKYAIGFHRLSINDMSEKGHQPFVQNDRTTIVNGEIYNHNELREIYNLESNTHSDCEVVGNLLNSTDFSYHDIFNMLDAEFAGVSIKGDEVIAFRDPIGIRPLFYTENDEFIGFASEAKALVDISPTDVKIFPIGSYWIYGDFIQYNVPPKAPVATSYNTIRSLLIQGVEKRVKNCDAEIGFFLSGGLDSSLVAAIAKNIMPNKKLKTFSIGMSRDSPDLRFANIMAFQLDSEHHEVIFTEKEGIEAIANVIYHTESYDCTTIRASVPMFLLCEYIVDNTDVKVMLSGEGADELFGGYLYFHNAPSKEELHEETERLVNEVHMFDSLRADRTTNSCGLEVRVPFFDKNFINYIRNVSPEAKLTSPTGIEKYILRRSFTQYPHMPANVLWRQKDAFSDAVGYNWISILKKLSETKISDASFERRHIMFPIDTPQTKEDFYYRQIYTSIFSYDKGLGSRGKWLPKWNGNVNDPSATYLKTHENSKV